MSPDARLKAELDQLRNLLARLSHVRDKRREDDLLERARQSIAAVRLARAAVRRAEAGEL